MTARAPDSPRYSPGYEWRNSRGQIFTQVGVDNHPAARADGFVPRARLVMEDKIGRYLMPAERVYHVRLDEEGDYVDGDPSDDSPENLWLFPNQKELSQHRSLTYHAKKERRGGGWSALTPAQREWREAKADETRRTKEWAEANRLEAVRIEKLRAAVAARRARKAERSWAADAAGSIESGSAPDPNVATDATPATEALG